MGKTHIRYEVVSVEVAEKILEQENFSTKRNGDCKHVVTKSVKTRSRPHTLSKKAEVSES
jgi:hypothetical protein